MRCAEGFTTVAAMGCQALFTTVLTAKSVGGVPPSSLSVYASVMVIGTLNWVPVGPISQTWPTAPGTLDVEGVMVIMVFALTAPAGMFTFATPSPVAITPPAAPILADTTPASEELVVDVKAPLPELHAAARAIHVSAPRE